jgi:CYTH domain-containing protein
VAEVELDSEDEQPPLPEWVGQEVTGDSRYYNVNLVKMPFKDW